jgi:hypothetical protein
VPLHKGCRAVESALNTYEGCTISLRLRCIRDIADGPQEEEEEEEEEDG